MSRAQIFPSLKFTQYLTYVDEGGYQYGETAQYTALYSIFWTAWNTNYNSIVMRETAYFVARNTGTVAQTSHVTSMQTSSYTYVQYWHNPYEPDITQWDTYFNTSFTTTYDTGQQYVTQYYSNVWTATDVPKPVVTAVQTGITTLRYTVEGTYVYVESQTAFNTWHYTRW